MGARAPRLSAFAPADEVVAEMLGQAERRQDEARLNPRERKLIQDARRKEELRAEKARAKAASQADQRTFLLLPAALKARLETIATSHGIPVSQAVAFLLFDALGRLDDGEIDFGPYLEPSYSPKYEWELVHPEDRERSQKRLDKKQKNRRST